MGCMMGFAIDAPESRMNKGDSEDTVSASDVFFKVRYDRNLQTDLPGFEQAGVSIAKPIMQPINSGFACERGLRSSFPPLTSLQRTSVLTMPAIDPRATWAGPAEEHACS